MTNGETTSYGMVSVDQDIGSSAHPNHHPILSRLESDTEYLYRLQGTAPDGTTYISEDITFRTPAHFAEAEVNPASLDVSASIISVCSNFGGTTNAEPWGANSAIDGYHASAWSSDGDGKDAFIEIRLAQPAHLHEVEIWTRSMNNNTAQIFSFTLRTETGDVLGPYNLDDADQSYRFQVNIVTESLRFDVTDNKGGNTGLIEFAAYGTPVQLRKVPAHCECCLSTICSAI